MKSSSATPRGQAGGLVPTLLLFVGALTFLLHGVFLPGQTLFSNDGPLGELFAQCHHLPQRFTGCWSDLNSIGFNGGVASPGISFGLQWLLGPILFSKFYAILSLLILGLGAWCFFRQSRLAPLACVLGGLAMMLNSTCFSVACWGVGAHDITVGVTLLALAALAARTNTSARQTWLRLVLAGMAVGMGVTEGADVGAIFSLFVGAFILYQAWIAEGGRAKNLAVGLGRLALVTVCATFLAAQSLYGLVVTSIKGVAGTQQDTQTKAQRWDWATQWSLPKRETLSLVVPGLFGYRMDTPGGGLYWGRIGRDPAWDRYLANGSQGTPPKGFFRYSGGGSYAGGLVVLVACWAAAQSLRRKDSAFSLEQRKWLWFWLGVAGLSLALAFGRFAPFYRLIYALPYFSTIRNPVKFLSVFEVALVVLFAFGIDGLWRRYLQPSGAGAPSRWAGLGNWWRRATRFEKYWVYGCGLGWVVSWLAWLDYAWHGPALEHYLESARLDTPAAAVASFSIHQVGWFVLVFLVAAVLLVLVFSGAFAGQRARWGGVLLGLLLLADLGLANQPWIIYWDYWDKYATNPVIELLRDKPHEHRVVVAPMASGSQQRVLHQVYQAGWLPHQFPYYNIQSFDVVEMPRVPKDFSAFVKAMSQTNGTDSVHRFRRAWQLTNTRYILGPAELAHHWNQQGDLAQTPLQVVSRFSIVPKPGVAAATKVDQVTAVLAPNGPFALLDFTGTLPRAKLYAHWQINTNDAAVLEQLFSPEFDPGASVFVAGGFAAAPAANGPNPPDGRVEFVNYAPKDVVLKTEAGAPSVLLLNDHFDPNWKVFVDGRPEKVLRCNFLMRGVGLASGAHTVEFKFQPPVGTLYVSLAAVATALLAVCLLIVSPNQNRASAPSPTTSSSSAASGPQHAPKRNQRENRKRPDPRAKASN